MDPAHRHVGTVAAVIGGERARAAAVTLAVGLVLSLTAACEPEGADAATAKIVPASPRGVVAAGAEPVVEASRFLLASAPAVVLVPADADAEALRPAARLGIPALPDGPAGRAEAKRLGATVVSATDPDTEAVRAIRRTDGAAIATTSDPSPLLAQLAKVAGASVVRIAADPRTDPASAAALRATGTSPVLTVGAPAYPVAVAQRDAQVIAGGYLALPGHHYLAMYGHPSGPALGVLGEQGPKASVARVRRLVAKYRKAAPETSFAPAFEIIATVATASAGPRKDYSARTSIADLRPLVDEARRAKVTVILDLQPGRGSLLEQARHYQPLLEQPHVGLAIDPEWKLGKKGKPLRRIGHVDAAEINAVSQWLATLTRDHVLPQKLFVLHQFQTQMIRHRGRLVTTHPELATVLHVDGQGPPGAKFGTWRTIRKDPPPGVFWGWKNFVDEDAPMLSPSRTWKQVRPHPDLITYQ